ncbi:MAG: hypothetical protein WCD49_17375 [Candidatus Acidiferrales bacterium]
MAPSLGRQRRSKRLPLSIPVRVYGRTIDNQPFRRDVETKAVSVHGGLLSLGVKVKAGQTLLLVNSVTEEERECRVVYVGRSLWSRNKVGVEFTRTEGDFWHVYGTLVGLKQVRIADESFDRYTF